MSKTKELIEWLEGLKLHMNCNKQWGALDLDYKDEIIQRLREGDDILKLIDGLADNIEEGLTQLYAFLDGTE